jgi:hypothetical protein
MKRVAITALILILIPITAFSKDIDPRELLSKVDVSHPYYGNKVYGGDKVNVFHSADKTILLVYQARYGGDGEHTENLLKLFKFQDHKGMKLLDQNVDSVELLRRMAFSNELKGNMLRRRGSV